MAEHRLGTLVVVLAYTGLRIGEVLAIRWEDVDFDGGVLRVTGTMSRSGGEWLRTAPKTRKSNRTVELVPQVLEALRTRRRKQAAEQLAMGEQWRDTLGLAFTTVSGTPIDHRNALRIFQSSMATVGVKGGFHTMRHSAATMLLTAGVPMRVTSEVLGHSSTAVTADIYSHVTASMTREAMETIGKALG